MFIPISGRTIKSQSQQLILNLLDYFEREKVNGGSLIPLVNIQEPSKKSKDLPESSKMNIRHSIYKMYKEKKHVTVDTLKTELKKLHILLSKSSLNRALHEIGFKFHKESNRRALVEKHNIALNRIHFMRNYRNNDHSEFKRKVVFLDETWIFSRGNPGKSWQDNSVASVRKPEGYDGKRFIILHAGTETGFVDNASLVFASKSQKEDYHGEMNGDLFKKWVNEKLICNLEEPCLIIMDNASYHSTLVEKQPTSVWKKADIASWLTKNNIPYSESSFKADLLELAKLNKKEKRYEVDELLRIHGHEVLRLPPYHCEFNAIELVWAHCKTYYNKNIGRDGYGDDKVISMWNEALQNCTSEIWQNCIRHTEKVIADWYKREKLLDVTVKELIISVSNDSSSDSDSDR